MQGFVPAAIGASARLVLALVALASVGAGCAEPQLKVALKTMTYGLPDGVCSRFEESLSERAHALRWSRAHAS